MDAVAVEACVDDFRGELSAPLDYSSAARVDTSWPTARNVQARIWKTCRREAEVIYPPVDVESFYCKPAEDYAGGSVELVAYKRIDTLVRASHVRAATEDRRPGRSIVHCGRSRRRTSNSGASER